MLRPHKRKMAILNGISSVLQPGRMTLLLGPPAAGKSTLLKALAGKLVYERSLKVRHARFNPTELPICLHLRRLWQHTPYDQRPDIEQHMLNLPSA